MKYRCKICGYMYDEEQENTKFIELPNYTCKMCSAPARLFEIVDNAYLTEAETVIPNAVKISKDNIAIRRIVEECINCGQCKLTCTKKEALDFEEDSSLCVNCGQCITTCPTKCLKPFNDISKLEEAKQNKKICIAYISPATRVTFGEIFNLPYGTFTLSKLVGFLKHNLGFDYVLDTTFGADLTIMEEASELIARLQENKNLPMFTSCCPAWVKYAKCFYPDLLPHISSCKSPIGMMGSIVKTYFTKINNLDKDNIFTVAITPCTAKKYEITLEGNKDTNAVITLYEIAEYIKKNHLKYENIKEDEMDTIFGEGSGAGIIFGNTGGVMEAALRTAYHFLTNKTLQNIEFTSVRGLDGVREAIVKIKDQTIHVAIVDGMSNAKKLLKSIQENPSKYQFIEVMNCVGGCIGGGGQPLINTLEELKIKNARIKGLYQRDQEKNIRSSYENPDIIKLYNDYLEKPLSPKAKELLHTNH